MSRIVTSPPKYHPSEWHASNSKNFQRSDIERHTSERLRAECERLRQEAEDTTARSQRDVNHKFSQRLNNIRFWKDELEEKLREIAAEIESVQDRKKELEKALHATKFPLEVAQSCLSFREQRTGVDLVHDEVEIQLMKEIEVIQGIQSLLSKTHDEAVEQIRLLNSRKYKLEKDLTDKFSAQGIDENCTALTDRTPGLGFSPGTVQVQSNSITPGEWKGISDDNIKLAEQERIASVTLRGVINSVLEQTSQDLIKQRKVVNTAFNRRIREVTEAKMKLESHLTEVRQEILSMEQNISQLQRAIDDKVGPMKLAHTQLNWRSQRPNNELVRDPVQFRLVAEVDQIEMSVQQLQQRLAESDATLKRLNRTELVLQDDIEMKSNSLHVDIDLCMTLRKQLEA